MRSLLGIVALLVVLAPAWGQAQNIRLQSAGVVSASACPAASASASASSVCDGTMLPGSVRWCVADGTTKDMTTGNVWLRDVDCADTVGSPPVGGNLLNFTDSQAWAAALSSGRCSLLDGSVAGDWALPSLGGFLTLVNGVEPVSDVTPRAFRGTIPTRSSPPTQYWTVTPFLYGILRTSVLDHSDLFYGFDVGDGEPPFFPLHHLPIRLAPPVTSITSGRSYSLAPSSALNPVAGTSYSTRSYLSVAFYDPPPLYIALAGWDDAARTPRIFFFEEDPEYPGYFRIRHGHVSGIPSYLQVAGASPDAGTQVIGWLDPVWPTGDQANNRRWKPLFVCGKVMLQSQLSGMCMHIETNDGKFLRQEPCNARNPNQLFVFTQRQDG